MTAYILFAILAAVCIGYIVRSKRKEKPPVSGWRVLYSAGVTLVQQGAGWAIDIPASPGHLNYVMRYGGPATTIRYRVEGGPILQSENGQPATAGLMLQRKGDSGSARGKYAGYRWFSRAHLPLTEGEHVVTVPLDASHWGPVMADPQAASFADCLANLEGIAVVFGGTGGRGHGVYGTGRIELLSLN